MSSKDFFFHVCNGKLISGIDKTNIRCLCKTAFLAGLLLFMSVSVHPSEQDKRNDRLNLYQLPHEIITPQDMLALQNLQEEEKVTAIESMLNKYFAQFIDHKRIWEDRSEGPLYNTRLDYNSIRLISHRKNNRISETYVIRDSPVLSALFRQLGDLYFKANNIDKSMASYLSALQYRPLASGEDYMIHPDRLNEIYNPEEKSLAQTLQQQKQQMDKSKKDLKLKNDKVYLLQSRLARNKISQTQSDQEQQVLKQEISALQTQIKTQSDILAITRKNYQKYIDEKKDFDSDLLYDTAVVSRQIGQKNKERQKVSVNSRPFLYDYRKNTNFPGYLGFLQTAHAISPQKEKIILAIAEEFFTTGKNRQSLDYYKKYIQLTKGTQDKNLWQACFNTARLYAAEKNYPLAAEFYNLALENNPDKKPDLYFEMAEFYETKTGNLQAASGFYSNWLAATEKETALPEKLQHRKKRYQAYLGIASFYLIAKKPELEKENLLLAYELYAEIKKQKENLQQEVSRLKLELLGLKKKLLGSSSPDDLALYRENEIQFNEKSLELKNYQAIFHSIAKSKMLIRLAWIYEKEKDYQKALQTYTEITETGNQHEINIALQNIRRLEKSRQDGIQRDRINF